MSMRRVRYNELLLDDRPTIVEPLDEAQMCELTEEVLGLIVVAYTIQHEHIDGLLPHGVWAANYTTTEARERFRNVRIPSVFADGGGYCGIFGSGDASQLISLLKT